MVALKSIAFYVTIFISIVWTLSSILDLRLQVCLLVLSSSLVQSLVMTVTFLCLLGLPHGPGQLLDLIPGHGLSTRSCAGIVLSDLALPSTSAVCWDKVQWGRSPWVPDHQIFSFHGHCVQQQPVHSFKSTHWAPIICQSLYHCWEYNSEEKCIFILVIV